MIWVRDSLDELAWHYMEGTHLVGTIRNMPSSGRWMATTNKRYLGTYAIFENAQKAVEAKRRVENRSGPRGIIT